MCVHKHVLLYNYVCAYAWINVYLFVLQGISFLNSYLNLRGKCQEAYYNLGRAMHQMGQFCQALHALSGSLTLRSLGMGIA